MDALREREDQAARVIQVALGLATSPTLLVVANADEVEVQAGIDLAARARGRVLTEVETTARLGSTAPTMSADALHPLIWSAASGRWESGHYSDAVQRAATALSGYVKDQTERYELGDSQLMLQAFSLDSPQQDRPRLRWPGNDDDLTVKSMREGILYMARGVFAAVRNPASHSIDEMPKQEALEQLATLSILARWIEQCELVTL
ncbi:TIGR02391 family protein [Microbacterium sp. F51-2R]|uniref:TIGR02391 family protein n=1 Tax=Microbacterium sp. F51-2R TaxID=3445777 RepID=UPI003FA0154A